MAYWSHCFCTKEKAAYHDWATVHFAMTLKQRKKKKKRDQGSMIISKECTNNFSSFHLNYFFNCWGPNILPCGPLGWTHTNNNLNKQKQISWFKMISMYNSRTIMQISKFKNRQRRVGERAQLAKCLGIWVSLPESVYKRLSMVVCSWNPFPKEVGTISYSAFYRCEGMPWP